MSQALVFALVLGAALLSCSGADDPGPKADTCEAGLPDSSQCQVSVPSYAVDVAPIVHSHCATCHFAGNQVSTQALETRAQIVGALPRVESQIYRCLMPPSDGTALAPDQRRTLLQWLVCGAPDN